MNLDNFYEKYTPLLNPFYHDENACSWGGCMLEVYGKELEYVLSFANNPALRKNVWTILEGDFNITCVCADYHLVNRMGYLITDQPWEDEGEAYEDEDDWDPELSEFLEGGFYVLIESNVYIDDETGGSLVLEQ